MENSEHESGELSDGELMSDIVQQPPLPPPETPLSPIKEKQQQPTSVIVVDELNEITIIFKEFQKNKLIDGHTTVIKFYQQRKNNDSFYKSIHSFIKSNKSIHQITVILSFIITIFEILYKFDDKLSFEYFTEILYKTSITESPDNLASIVFFSKYFNSNKDNNNNVYNMVFSFLEWENKKTIINNGIKFLGSILSLSISLGMYNILQITFNWLINFKRIDKPSNISLEISDVGDIINNIDNQYITIKILDILINDHLILNESSNNFENLPKYSFDFAQLLTSIILSNYLNNGVVDGSIDTGGTGGNNESNNNEINPKLLSLLSNYWILEKPQLLLSNCFKPSTINNVNILQETIKLCIFSNYELVEPYIIKLNSILMNTIFQISESVLISGGDNGNGNGGDSEEFSTKLIKYLTGALNPSFFESIITNINNNKKSTTNTTTITIDKLAQIIQICSLLCYKKQEYIQSHIQLLSKLKIQTKLSNTILNQKINK